MFHSHDHAGWQTLAAAGSLAVGVVVTALAAVARHQLAVAAGRMGDAITRRRPVWPAVVFALSLTISAAVAWHAGLPHPIIHDEFGYLLAADTFAHGRLTNPTPPGADALQSPHELLRPTYMSKYPPGQGLALAAGQAMTGLPIVGVWLTAALAAAAIDWAALPFVPVPWALLAGVAAALHPQLVDWSHVFWGGSVAELGGALVIGAAARIVRSIPAAGGTPRAVAASSDHPTLRGLPPADGTAFRHAIVLGVGLALLALSRPFEGLATVLPLLVVLRRARRILLPLAIVLLPTAAFQLYDDHRVTGHILTPPIVAYAQQFDVYPKVWLLPRRDPPPAYANELLAAVHLDFERGDHEALRTPAGLARISAARLWRFASTYANPWVLLLPLALSPLDRRARWIWATLLTLMLSLWAETFFLPHYAAPAVGGVAILVTVGWRRLWPPLAVGVGVAFLAGAIVSAATIGTDPKRTGRDDVVAALGGGPQLVVVRYLPGHGSADEWVFNDAEPPAERVVWAHARGPAGDKALADLYPGRHRWLLTVGAADLRLVPYP